MFDSIIDSIVEALTAQGLYAVRRFPADKLDSEAPLVCIGIKAAQLTASGLGNYIGLCRENGEIMEMYGSRAELTLSLEIFSPTPDCNAFIAKLIKQLGSVEALSVKSFDAGEVSFDSRSGMFRCECIAKGGACLVRELADSDVLDFKLEGEI